MTKDKEEDWLIGFCYECGVGITKEKNKKTVYKVIPEGLLCKDCMNAITHD